MRCSFCRRHDSEVAKLAAGPRRALLGRVYICDRCAVETIQVMDARAGGDGPREEGCSLFRRMLNRIGWSRPRDGRNHRSNRRSVLGDLLPYRLLPLFASSAAFFSSRRAPTSVL